MLSRKLLLPYSSSENSLNADAYSQKSEEIAADTLSMTLLSNATNTDVSQHHAQECDLGNIVAFNEATSRVRDDYEQADYDESMSQANYW